MADYTIKGNDEKEYGPANAETIKNWIKENRIASFSQIKIDGGDFQRADNYPEFAPLFSSLASVSTPPPVQPSTIPAVARLDAMKALSQGWQVFKNNPGLAFGGVAVYLTMVFFVALVAIVPIVGFLVQLAFIGPLLVGFYKFCLNFVDNDNPKIGDLFDGFNIFPTAMLANVLKSLMTIMIAVPFIGILFFLPFYKDLASQQIPQGAQLVLFIGWCTAIAIVIVVLMTLFWFVEFLLADRATNGLFETFKTSATLALRNLVPLAILFTLASLIMLGGLAFVFVGIFLVLPWVCLSFAHAYRQIVPRGAKG